MTSTRIVVLLGLGLGVLAGCSGSANEDTGSGAGAATEGTAKQKRVDDACFVAYSHSAGECNASSGADDAAFATCLKPVKAGLVSCCKGGGSASCAADAADTSAAQKKVDDQCFVTYSQGAGQCNTSAGDDDAAFDKCLKPLKASLVTCCKGGGSASCAEDAADVGAAQTKVDDQCFAEYSHSASGCNTTAGGDDAAFGACLTPIKAELTACCKKGGSPSCDGDAK